MTNKELLTKARELRGKCYDLEMELKEMNGDASKELRTAYKYLNSAVCELHQEEGE